VRLAIVNPVAKFLIPKLLFVNRQNASFSL
jgi:hypothetical protein